MTDPADRLRQAAFALFDQQGYAATTVGQIAERAGVGRTTFFRIFGSKEDVIFPDHEALLARVAARLATLTATDTAAPVGVLEASRIVLEHYLEEGELARARYRLTRSVPELRDRELAGTSRYQRLFRDALRAWTREEDGDDLRAELIGGAVVTAHNHVLRRWLRSDEPLEAASETARRELDQALHLVLAALASPSARQAPAHGADGGHLEDRTTVVVLRSGADLEDVVPRIRAALQP